MKPILRLFVLFAGLFIVGHATALGQITPPSYSNVAVSYCSLPSTEIPLPSLVFQENNTDDFAVGAGVKFTLSVPASFTLSGTFSLSANGADLSAASATLSDSQTLLVTFTSTATSTLDRMTISGLSLVATSSGATGTVSYNAIDAVISGMTNGYALLGISADAAAISVSGGTLTAVQKVCLNEPLNPFAVTSATASATYQWEVSVNDINYNNISGQTGVAYTPSSTASGTLFYRRQTIVSKNGVSCSAPSNSVSVTIIDLSAGTIAADQNTCYGDTPTPFTSTLDASAMGEDISYSWEKSTDNQNTWQAITNNSATYAPAALTQTTHFRRIASSTTCTATKTSNVVTVSVGAQLNGGTATGSQNLCLNDTPTALEVNNATSSGGTITYQWESSTTNNAANFTPVTGTGSQTATFSPPTNSAGTTYYRRITTATNGANACSKASTVVTVVVTQVNGGVVSGDQTICFGANPTAISVSGDTAVGTIAYQWYSSTDNTTFNIMGGETGPTLTPTYTQTGTLYFQRATFYSGAGTCSDTSDVAILKVIKVLPGAISSSDTSLCYGTDGGTLASDTDATAMGETITYSWQKSINGGSWSTISTNAATLATGVLTQTTSYRRLAQSTTCGTDVISNEVTINVAPQALGGTISANQDLCLGAAASPLTISGDSSTGNLSYIWYSSTDQATWSVIGGETGVSYTPSTVATGTKYYYRKTTVTYSGYTCVASSTIATIAVSDLSAGSIGGTQTICLGEVPTTLTSVADATGNTVSYQWQQSIDDGATWTNLSGSGSATNAFTPAATITQTTQFKRNATSVSCGTSASSNVVYVYVNRFPNSSLAITFNDNSNTPVDICPGADPFPLKDNSTLTGDGDITYLWQKSTDNGTSWSSATGTNNQVTYDPPTVSVDIWYRRQTTSTLNTDTCVDYTNTLKFIAGNNADPGSVKTTNPDTGNDNLEVICSGDIPKPIIPKAAASVTNGTLTYQWFTSTSNPYSWVSIGGATSDTYTPTAITQTTYYMRAVTNTYASGNCTIYNPNTIVQVIVPTAGSFNSNQVVCYNNAPTTFTENVASIGPSYLQWKWQKSTDNASWSIISGATNASYTSGTLTQTTYFRRLSTTVVGTTTCATDTLGDTITVTVLNPSAGSISGGEDICVGDDPAPILNASFGSAGGTYKWYTAIDFNNPVWVQIPGASDSSYDPPIGLTQTTYYKRETTLSSLGKICATSTNSVTIKVGPSVTGGTLTTDQILCPGANPTTLTVTGGSTLSGITYSWYSSTDTANNETLIGTATATSYTPPRPAQTTWYKRVTTWTDGSQSCTGATNWVKITTNDLLPGTIGSAQTICAGETPAQLLEASVVTNPAAATISYQWKKSTDGSNWNSIPGATARNYAPTALTQTTYYKRAVFGQINAVQCEVESSVLTVTVTPLPVINNALIAANDLTMVSCFGGSDGAINIDPSRISGGNSAQQQIVTLTVSGTLATGDVMTLQLNGTSYSHTVTAGQTNAQVAAALAALVNGAAGSVVSANVTDVVITLSADVSGTAFTYLASAGSSAQGQLITVLTQANALPNSYAWTKVGGGFTASTLSISSLTVGQYTLTVTNGGCNVSSSAFTITQPAVLDLVLATGCSDTLTATPSGGNTPYTFSFTDPAGNVSTQSSSAAVVYPNLTEGAVYTVSIQDAGCSTPVTKSITIPVAMQLDAAQITATNPSCTTATDGALSLGAGFIVGGTSPYSYAWTSNAYVGTKTTKDITALGAGNYTLIVTDALGCSATATTTLTALTPLAISTFAPAATQRLSCNGATDGTFNISISSDPAITPIIRWYEGTTLLTKYGTNTLSVTDLSAGNYRVDVSNGLAGACLVSQAFTITEPDAFTAVLDAVTNPLCFTNAGGQATISVTGGTGPYYFTIDGGSSASFGTASATAFTYTIQGISAGAHTIVITDSNSCAVSTQSVNITVPALLEVTHEEESQVTPIGCTTPGSLSVTATGGTTPYFYTWTGPNGYSVAGTSATANDIFTPGNYTVKVTDKNQCTQTLNVNMPNTATPFTVSGVVTSEQCVSEESTNSSILLTLSPNIVAPFTIAWEKYGPKTNTVTSSVGSATVSTTTTVFGWNEVPGSAGKLNLTGLGFGEYRATVQDANTAGCNTVVKAFTIAKSSLSIFENTLTPPTCENPEASYSFKLNTTNALKYYLNGAQITPSSSASSTFSLSNTSGKYTLSKLLEGSYTLRIVAQVPTGTGTTTTEGCELFTNFTITNYQPISYGGETNVTLNLCDNEATFPDTALVSGGVPFEDENGDPFYIYQWNGPNNLVTQGSAPISVNSGTYELRIIDAQNCITDPITFNFSNNVAAVSVTETITPLGCGVGNTNGAINISISGGKAPYNIVWEREIPGTEENPSPTYAPIGTNLLAVNNLAAGRYRLSITSSFVSCDNTEAITFTKFYELAAVETLQLLEGPFLSKSLCVGEPGTLQVKVFDRDSDTFSFYYDGTLVSSTPVGNDTYELTIDSPVDEAILNILNESGCGISVPIITGVGTPEFSYTSRSLEQTGLISANEDVTFTNTSIEPYTKMRWDFGDGSDLLEITAENEATTDIVHRYKTPGTFTVALRFYNALGCYKEVTQEVRVGKGYLVIFPSAFTPNEDGVNDLFEAKYTGITAFTIDIFDMWGNLLYTATVDSLPTTSLWGWNGTYPSGQPYTFKTFRYSFTAITHDDQEIKTAGEATLLR